MSVDRKGKMPPNCVPMSSEINVYFRVVFIGYVASVKNL